MTTELQEYTDDKRLEVYKMLTTACKHLYSKGKLQEDKFIDVADIFADISKNDPTFMAHLTAYCNNQNSKDLKVLTVFFNSLNDADGTPFFKGSKKNKPNYRQVSYSILQDLDPHLALRVLQLANKKFAVKGILNKSRHFPTGLKTAYKKYLKYRENRPNVLNGIKNAGLKKKMQKIYRLNHVAPTDEAAAILGWKQKDGRDIKIEKMPDFKSMTSKDIAVKIEEMKLSPVVALTVIPQDKITANVAKALLNNATGNQSIILYNFFSENGFLDVKSIKSLFGAKVSKANTAVDRIDTLTKDADEEDKKEMSKVRSEVRKKTYSQNKLGKIFVHIDISSSMSSAIKYAKENTSIIAECVNDPKNNFMWGTFNSHAKILNLPDEFTKEDFHSSLYGVRASGTTDCIALYDKARKFGAEVDIYITDQGHNIGNITKRINEFHDRNPDLKKPKAAIVIDFSGALCKTLSEDLIKSGIPTTVIPNKALNESALIVESVTNAVKGEMAVIDEILETPLPKLPKWWASV